MKKLLGILFIFCAFSTIAQTGRDTLKSYFETGDVPTQAQFSLLIDAMYNKAEEPGLKDSTWIDAYIKSLPGYVETSATGTELDIMDGALLTTTELNYSVGLTGNIQTQLDAKVDNTDLDTIVGGVYSKPQVDAKIDSLATVLRTEFTVFSTEYQAVYDAYVTPPSIDTAKYQATLMDSLVAIGIVSNADVLYVTANNNEANALIDWKSPGTYNLTNSGSATFTAYEGFTGNGTSMQLSTNYNPSTDATNYTQNDAALSVYTRLNVTDGVAIGASSANYSYITPRSSSGYIYSRINSTDTPQYYAVSDAFGLTTVTRTTSTDINFYKNGNSLGSKANASSGLPGENLYLLSRGGLEYSANQVSFAYIGGSLTANQVERMNTAVEKYMDSIGKGVQP